MRFFIAILTLVLTISFALAEIASAKPKLLENPTSVRGGLVVSVDPIASRVGAQVLAKGGNAVDAAVATALALAVTWPEAGNLGGGGFMVVRLAETGECFVVDYREKAPRSATPDMFLDEQGNVDREKAGIGWWVVGVPGSPMGLWLAHQKAGKLPWQKLVAPAVRLAAEATVANDPEEFRQIHHNTIQNIRDAHFDASADLIESKIAERIKFIGEKKD